MVTWVCTEQILSYQHSAWWYKFAQDTSLETISCKMYVLNQDLIPTSVHLKNNSKSLRVLQKHAWRRPKLMGWDGPCSCVDGVLGFVSEALASLARRPHHIWDLMKTLQEARTSGPHAGRYSRHCSGCRHYTVDGKSLCKACC